MLEQNDFFWGEGEGSVSVDKLLIFKKILMFQPFSGMGLQEKTDALILTSKLMRKKMDSSNFIKGYSSFIKTSLVLDKFLLIFSSL